MPTTEHPGLRDRKREQTRARLESAAVRLVLSDGLEHATIDSISADAGVSSRTFFNYFDTKEDSVLGIRDIELTPEKTREHVARHDGGDVVPIVIALLFEIMSPTIEGAGLHESRREILRRHPHLLGRQVAQMSRMVDQLLIAVMTVLEHDDGASSSRPADRATAEMLLTLCGGAVRTAVKEWVDAGTNAPIDSLEPRANQLVTLLLERIR